MNRRRSVSETRHWPHAFDANRRKMRTDGRAATLKRTSLVFEGHSDPGAPALETTGHDGLRHQPRWDAARQRYELDVDHNGVVQLTLTAAGTDTNRKPPRALPRDLAVGRPTTPAPRAEGGGASCRCGQRQFRCQEHLLQWTGPTTRLERQRGPLLPSSGPRVYLARAKTFARLAVGRAPPIA